jgi:Flp pilus assembly protein CpaB
VGEVLRTSDFASGATARGDDVLRALKSGLRAMAIRVDQVTGVGTLIQPGDRIDIVVGLKVTSLLPGKESGDPPFEMPGGPQLTVKNVVQNVEVLATLVGLPEGQTAQGTTTTTTEGSEGAEPQTPGVGLTGQEQIVIVAVTSEQAEVIKLAQVRAMDSPELTVSLILRSPADREAPADKTGGITLNTLIEKYGVLPPFPLAAEPIR